MPERGGFFYRHLCVLTLRRLHNHQVYLKMKQSRHTEGRQWGGVYEDLSTTTELCVCVCV